MSLCEGVHSGDSETRTLIAFCGEKRLENPTSDFRWDSGTIVCNLNPGSVVCSTCEHRNPTFTLEGIYGVEEEIHEGSHAVCRTNQRRRRRPQLQHQFNPTQPRPTDLDGFVNHFIKVCRNCVTLFGRLPAEVSQALDGFKTAGQNAIHSFQRLENLIPVSCGVTQVIRVQHQWTQKVLQIMRNACRHLAKCTKFLCSDKCVL